MTLYTQKPSNISWRLPFFNMEWFATGVHW